MSKPMEFHAKIKCILICMLSFFCEAVHAQLSISGHVYNPEHESLSYSSVTLTDKNGSIHSVSANNDGLYSFKGISKGTYQLTIGYLREKYTTNDFFLKQDTIINVTFISPSTKQLSEVQVRERRPVLERKVDRLVFNITESPAMQGLDLLDALENTPMVKVNDGGISLVGKGDVAVMVNDRLLNLSGSALTAYLRTLRSDNIAKIEIITNPPSKYDAQGNSGLINIVLKKNAKTGFNGSLKGSYMQRTYGTTNFDGVLNYGSDKLSVSASIEHYHANIHAQENEGIYGTPTSILKSNTRKDFNDGNDFNLSADYRLNSKSSFGFMYDLLAGNANMNISSRSNFLTNAVSDSLLATQAEHRNKLRYKTANVYYDLKLDSNGKKLSITGNYLGNSSDHPVNFMTENLTNNNGYTVLNTSKVDYKILSGQADLELPSKKGPTFETGVKYSHISNNADVGYFNLIDDNYNIVPDRSNIFHYKEQNYAGYISGFKEFNKIWSVKAGLRYEFTNVDGNTPTSNEHIGFNYGKLFPSLFINFTPGKSNQFSASYSRRINRPGFNQLNPFRWYSDPYTYLVGNPQLLPSFSNNYEISYVYKSNLSITAYHQQTSHGSGQVLQTEGTTSISTFLNYLTSYSTGLNIYYTYNDIKWWQSIVFADVNYAKSISTLPQFVGQKGSSFSYQVNNSFFLNEKKTYSLILNYQQSLPSWVGNVRWSSRANLTAGINTSFLNKDLQVSLIGRDLFRQSINKGKVFLSDSFQDFNSYYDARRATLSVTYRFGNKKVKVVNKDTRFDEKSRAN